MGRAMSEPMTMTARHCGDCQLCCILLPVKELGKGGNTRCQYQRHRKGCMVYRTPAMPFPCQAWNCRWLLNDDTGDLSRPDRSGFVVDVQPDFITVTDTAGAQQKIPCVQVWMDPNRPDAHRDPALRAYLARRAAGGHAAIIRNGSHEGFVLFAPVLTSEPDWIEVHSAVHGAEHTQEEVAAAFGGLVIDYKEGEIREPRA